MSAQCQSENEAAAGQGAGRAGRSPPSRGTTVFPNLHSTHPMRRLFMKRLPPARQGSGGWESVVPALCRSESAQEGGHSTSSASRTSLKKKSLGCILIRALLRPVDPQRDNGSNSSSLFLTHMQDTERSCE